MVLSVCAIRNFVGEKKGQVKQCWISDVVKFWNLNQVLIYSTTYGSKQARGYTETG